MLIASFILGLLLPQLANPLEPYIVPILVVLLTISIKDVAFYHLEKKDFEEIFGFLLLNYVILTGLYLLLTHIFIEPVYQNALFVLGLMPPAIGIIALARILKAKIEISFITEFVAYVLALGIIPLLSHFIFGESVGIINVLEVLGYVLIIPFILSRILHAYELKKGRGPEKLYKSVLNICYMLTFYIIVGVNRDILVSDIFGLSNVFFVLLFLKFGVGLLIYYSFKRLIKREDEVLVVLFSTMKNGGMAAAITIMLFGIEATLPLAINSITTPIYIVFVEWLFER